jgi:hypothetical protein
VSLGLQLAPQLREVINFAIEHDPDGAFLIRDWLMATLYVHDAEASDSERHGALDILPLIIGTSVHDRPEHFR